ncbi:UNKNOWN [Stylonychia lemnae]|uniref:Uncharacterized protein n=1 Tax=Stylonychia lemnae TaxID=5949 RepID=A0A078AG70_STYLE|nr:UNKNOWN [Stylonychia lemnae]|eukprot:CDW80831.1 UNKNOWN [Stylonychia lemnae]
MHGVVSELIALTSPQDFYDFLEYYKGNLDYQENLDNAVQVNKQQDQARVDGNQGYFNLQIQQMREDFIRQFQDLKKEMQLQSNSQIEKFQKLITQKFGQNDLVAQNLLESQLKNQDYDKNKIEQLKKTIIDLQERLNLGIRQSNESFFSDMGNRQDYKNAFDEILNLLGEDLSRIEEREKSILGNQPDASYDQEEQKQAENLKSKDGRKSHQDPTSISNGIASTKFESTGQNEMNSDKSGIGYADSILQPSSESDDSQNQILDLKGILVNRDQINESLDNSRHNESIRSNSQGDVEELDQNVSQNVIFLNDDENLIIGLNYQYSMLKHTKTGVIQAMRFNDTITSIFKLHNYLVFGLQNSKLMIISSQDYTIKAEIIIRAKAMKYLIIPGGQRFEYLAVFCQSGHIEIISIQSFVVLASLSHSSGMDFSDAAPTSKYSEYIVGFAHKNRNQYLNGMIASIILSIREVNGPEIQIIFEEIENSKVYVKAGKSSQAPIYCFAEAQKQDLFIVCTSDTEFKLYDHTQRKILQQTIPNPSQAENFNYLQKVCFYSQQYPYLIYKDSRSVGYIDCTDFVAHKISECLFKHNGNHHTLHQKEMQSPGQLLLHTLWYTPEDKSKNISLERKNININVILKKKENLQN